MKHLLIILSFLLLSSFLTSCEKKEGTFYLWETSSGKVWKTFGEEGKQEKYEGEVKKYIFWFSLISKPNGVGTRIFLNGDKYIGEYDEGRKDGFGIFTWSNGRKYVGSWKNGKKHGQGKDLFSDGKTFYEGGWKDGKYHGIGKLYNQFDKKKQLKYEGEWKNGREHGKGKG